MDTGPHEHRQRGAAVRIRCHRHEGIVLANDHHVPGLGRLAATWELVRADGRTLAAPAELPDLRPGETAAVSLPFGLPRDGGAAWLTLRVLTATDEPGAPRGTELCAPRILLPATTTTKATTATATTTVTRYPERATPAGHTEAETAVGPPSRPAPAVNRRRSRPLRAL
ncbi:hypothetical protein BIV23_37965 [Streptomyces monashensis]|uniref:Beta-galactosidase domain-containing protein n=1 Tax=Streptomyces monashensis TaxID=1678012 RepID=A0A1S2PHQ0_9ACTN|nr:hypothetical protein BIV23_37965 [Streptomyces monashensis]